MKIHCLEGWGQCVGAHAACTIGQLDKGNMLTLKCWGPMHEAKSNVITQLISIQIIITVMPS